MELKVNLLQVPRIWADGKEVSFPLRRADALLFYMVCNKTATREELVCVLWDQCDVETGRRNLRNILYVMKKHMGIDILISTQKNRLSLNPDVNIECDYLKFMEQGDYMAMHGPFLNGFGIRDSCAFDDWVDKTRERVHKQYLSCLTEQVKSTTRTGTVGRAERCALEYLQENPADETMARFLISLYQSQSKFFDGIQVYQRLYDYLTREMGISPFAETTKLYQKVLKEWNLAAGEQDEPAPEEYIPKSRRRLLCRLNEILFPSPPNPQREGGGILLQGGAGVGKTFLLERYLGNLEEGILFLQSTCFYSERKFPYSSWRTVIARVKETLIADQEVLPNDVLKFADRLMFERYPRITIDQAEMTISKFLDTLLRSRRVLLCLEGIQWADDISIQLLSRILHRFCHKPLSCLVTGRDILPDCVARTVDLMAEDRLFSVCSIRNFSLEEVRQYLQYNLDSKIAQAAQPVYEVTNGNPFLVKKLCQRCMGENNALETLQQQIGQIFEDRIEMLSAEGRCLLSLVSFFPEGAPKKLLSKLLELSGDEVDSTCRELLHASYLVEIERSDREFILAFENEVLQHRLYQQISLVRRQEMHRKIAQALEESPEKNLSLNQIAYHYEQVGDWLSVLRIRETQCEQFLKSSCGRTADEFQTILYQQVAKTGHHMFVFPTLPEGVYIQAKQWILLMRALAALFSKRETEAVKDLISLFAEDEEIDASLFHVSVRLISRWAWEKGCAKSLMERLDPYPQMLIRLLRGELLSVLGRWSQCEEELYPLLNSRNRLIRGYACHGLGRNYQRQNKQDADRWFQEAVSQIADLPTFWGIAQLYRDAGRWSDMIHDNRAARSLFETALYLAAQTDDLQTLAVAQAHLAVLMARDGQEEVAACFLKNAQKAVEDMSPFEQGTVCLAKAQLCRWQEKQKSPIIIWQEILLESAAFYSRRGLMLLYPLQDVEPECAALRSCLHSNELADD